MAINSIAFSTKSFALSASILGSVGPEFDFFSYLNRIELNCIRTTVFFFSEPWYFYLIKAAAVCSYCEVRAILENAEKDSDTNV